MRYLAAGGTLAIALLLALLLTPWDGWSEPVATIARLWLAAGVGALVAGLLVVAQRKRG